MRTLCDVCESAAAILFCSADEAALCRACDDKVHMCNKLASRHVRVGLAEPSEVPRCDICENAPAFFYCEVDGSSLCLQCDMIVHVGGKRTHERYLLLRQRAEVCGCSCGHWFPGDKPESLDESGAVRGNIVQAKKEPTHVSPNPIMVNNIDCNGKMENKLIDLNARPQRVHGRASTIQEQVNNLFNNHHEPENIVDGSFKREPENNGA